MLVHFLLFCGHWWHCFFQFSVDVQLAHRPKDRKNLVLKVCCKCGALLHIMLCCPCLFVELGKTTAGCRPGMWHQKRSGCVPLGYFYFHRGSQPMSPREPADVSARASRCSTPPVCLYFMKGNYLLNLPELFTNFPELFTKFSEKRPKKGSVTANSRESQRSQQGTVLCCTHYRWFKNKMNKNLHRTNAKIEPTFSRFRSHMNILLSIYMTVFLSVKQQKHK